jgi:NitT/TauT family transport system substrate-binding protein
VLRHYAGVATPLEASALVTTEFVPTGADFVPPRQA